MDISFSTSAGGKAWGVEECARWAREHDFDMFAGKWVYADVKDCEVSPRMRFRQRSDSFDECNSI